jgi:hypothetical protein
MNRGTVLTCENSPGSSSHWIMLFEPRFRCVVQRVCNADVEQTGYRGVLARAQPLEQPNVVCGIPPIMHRSRHSQRTGR